MNRESASAAFAAALLMLIALLPAAAEAPSVVVRTQLDPKEGAILGQPVRLLVEVLFPDAMPRPPRVGIGEAPGAQIIRFETQGVTIRDSIGERPYVGQRFEFVAFPRRGGVIEVPGAEVTILDSAAEIVGSAKGEPQRIRVTVPPGLDASQPTIATADLTVTQSWTPDLGQTRFKPGGALIRTIRRQAMGMPAMGMPDFVFVAPEGVRLYVDPPQSDDRTNRGEVTGLRIDKVTYVFEKLGTYTISDLKQSWWNLREREARTEMLSGRRVEIADERGSTAGRSSPESSMNSGKLHLALMILGALGTILLFFRTSIQASMRRFLDARRASTLWAQEQLCRIAPSGDASATYKALTVWLSRVPEAVRQASDRDARLERSVLALNRFLFGQGGAWSAADGATLKAGVTAFSRGGVTAAASAQGEDLPPLNPPIRSSEGACRIRSPASPGGGDLG